MSPAHDLYAGSSPAWLQVQREVDALAGSDLPLVLLGPTGCGKTALASYIHQQSGRPGPLLRHTLGSVPEGLSHSALLGHARGAYTGAVERHLGAFESAKGGTLFLDEIGLASPQTQQLLLGLLDGWPFRPLGASRTVAVDLRFVFATNSEPELLLAEGRWQPDFYYRMGGNFIRLPGLAQRRGDILALAQHFLRRRLRAMARDWTPRLSPELEDLFLRHPWPGNIRELQSVCDRAAVLTDHDRPVDLGDLTPSFLRECGSKGPRVHPEASPIRVREILRRHLGNKSAAARELGMHRTHLCRFLARHPELSSSDDTAQPA